MKAKGKRYFGTATDPGTFGNSQVASIIRAEFGSVTPENSMKWDATESSRGSFNFGNADALVNFATTNGKLIRGHTLVWHSQLPGWVSNINSASELTTVIQNHVATVAGRFKGKIDHWDVVNEVFEENGTFRNSVFYRLLGEQFIDIAFKAAKAADPNAKLYINDYNLDYAGSKINAMISLIGRLKSRGVPIDGVGTQAHLIAGNSINSVPAQIRALAATGLDVALTEIDIRIRKPVTSALLTQQATDYATIIKACVDTPKCVGATVWGVSDRNSWVDSTFPEFDAPLLFDDNYAKKAAYTSASNAMN